MSYGRSFLLQKTSKDVTMDRTVRKSRRTAFQLCVLRVDGSEINHQYPYERQLTILSKH